MTPRLNPGARRDLIVSAAVPLFARKGFAGTTTREIAEAAGVSEALVFKHFANKTALYDAIVQTFTDVNPTFAELQTLPPSTATLIRTVCVITDYFGKLAADDSVGKPRYRMFLRSLSEDGVFASVGIKSYVTEVRTLFDQSYDAARRAGDLYDDAPTAAVAFWMIARQHIMLTTWTFLSEDTNYDVSIEDNIRFILRGIGLKDAVVKRAMLSHADVSNETALPRERRRAPGERLAL